MRISLRKLITFLLLAAVTYAAVPASPTAAQYPPVAARLVCLLGQASGTADSAIPFTATLLDVGGNPVPNAPVSFAIADPGASLSATSDMTDANGVASTSILTGDSNGNVTVSASAGAIGCESVAQVLGTQVVSVSSLPRTGDGSASQTQSRTGMIAAAIAGSVAAAAAFVGLRRRASKV